MTPLRVIHTSGFWRTPAVLIARIAADVSLIDVTLTEGTEEGGALEGTGNTATGRWNEIAVAANLRLFVVGPGRIAALTGMLLGDPATLFLTDQTTATLVSNKAPAKVTAIITVLSTGSALVLCSTDESTGMT